MAGLDLSGKRETIFNSYYSTDAARLTSKECIGINSHMTYNVITSFLPLPSFSLSRLPMTRINLLTGRLVSGGRRIPLTQGQSAIVDDEDFERLNAHKWYAQRDSTTRSFYAHRHATDLLSGGQITLPLHRAILDQPTGNGLHVDHVDGNTLDNRRKNLQVLSAAEHMHKHRNDPMCNASRYGIGVYQSSSGRFQALSRHEGKLRYLGVYDTPEEASAAREEFLRSLDAQYPKTSSIL